MSIKRLKFLFALAVLLYCLLMTTIVQADPPQIGNLILPSAQWWDMVKREAGVNKIDACLVLAVMSIESRYDRYAVNKKHQSYGLMQLQKDVYRGMGVTDPFDPQQNIEAGAKILGRLWRRYDGDMRRILKKYNPTDTGAYSKEVMKAWSQARKREIKDESGCFLSRPPGWRLD